MEIIKLRKDNFAKVLNLARKSLENDQLVVVPSDTAYGLAAKATSPWAVQKVLDFKGRKPEKGISVFLKDLNKIKKYAYFDQNQEKIIRTLLPGPFTVILASKKKLAPELGPGDGTMAIRVIKHDFISQLLSQLNFPITATSANLSGKKPHYSIASFLNTLSEKKKQNLGLIVDAGQLPKVPVSTVVRLTQDKIKVLRKGVFNPRLVLTQKTKSAGETQKLAQKIFQSFLRKDLEEKAVVVILRGDLGAGKTVFAKGIGSLFGQEFFSPTFVLLDEHQINQPPVRNIYHLDLFRLESEEEVVDLELTQFLQKGNLLMIEWGEKLSPWQHLKNKNSLFFWLEIEEMGQKSREFKLYRI